MRLLWPEATCPVIRRARRAYCPGCQETVWLTGHNTFEEHDDPATYGECTWSGSKLPDDDDFYDEGYLR